MLHGEITELIIGDFYRVYNCLGYGFLEKVYENALANALGKHNLNVRQQASIAVQFEGQVVGQYYADLLINDLVIVELKAADRIIPQHEAQLLNYLKATTIDVGLLLNFGPKPEFKRKVKTSN